MQCCLMIGECEPASTHEKGRMTPSFVSWCYAGIKGHSYFAAEPFLLQDITAIMEGKGLQDRRVKSRATGCKVCKDRIATNIKGGGLGLYQLALRQAAEG